MPHFRQPARARGQALPELLVAIVISLVILSVGAGVIQALNGGLAQQIAIQQDVQTVQDLEETLRLAAASAASIYTPPTCSGATGGSGDDVPCASVRFYNVDSGGASHYWGFEYTAATHAVAECLTYANAYATTCANAGRTFSNVLAFSADPTPASEIAASIPTLASYTVTNVEPQIAGSNVDPSGRIVAGNRVMVITLSTDRSDREVDLLPAGTPVKVTVLVGAFTPPQLGTLAGPSPINLYVGQTQSYSYIENNYGQYAAYVPGGQQWSVSGCTTGSGPAAPSVAVAALTANTGDTGGVTIVGASPGTCNFTVTSADQVQTVLVNVYDHPAYQLTIAQSGPTSISAGGTSDFSATTVLKNPGQAPPGTPTSIPVTATSTNTDCNLGSNAGTPQPSGSAYVITGDAPGNCDINVVDSNGDQAQVTVVVAGSSGGFGSGGGATPDPLGTNAPTATPPSSSGQPGGPVPTAVPTALLGPCGNPNGFGNPMTAFVEPKKPLSPAMSSFYAAVSDAGTNKEIPNGNVLYGYEDDFRGYTTGGEKGAFLMAENIDCTITIILTTETFSESYIGGTYAFEWRDVPNGYSVDTAASLGGNDQGMCWEWGHNPDYFPDEPSPSCGTHGQQVDGRPPADLVSFEPVIDTVYLPFYKTPNPIGAARWVMHPDPRLNVMPVPLIGHYVNSFNMNFDYFPEIQGTLGLDGSTGATYMGAIPNYGAYPVPTTGLSRTPPMTPHP